MQVSVVIPVFNAEAHVRQAVESALEQPETNEVLLIEDGSPDGSLQVCEELASTHAAVRLLRHAHGENRGAGASRNLGIRESRCPFVGFLDADDYYLDGRFRVASEIFAADPTAEGVYEAVGVRLEPEAEERFARHGWQSSGLKTMSVRVPPEDLFESQAPLGDGGLCQTNGWVVARTVFDKVGFFPEHLRLHQDTVMFAKLAAKGRMVAGRLEEPVAIVRLHAQNRASAPRRTDQIFRSNRHMWGTLWRWSRANLEPTRYRRVFRGLVDFVVKPSIRRVDWPPDNRGRILRRLAGLACVYPGVVIESYFWRTCVACLLGNPTRSRAPRL